MVNPQLEHIWKEFSARLKSYIAGRVNDDMLAEDLLQEVFLKIHKNLENLKDAGKLQSWIYQITRNTITDHYRQRRIHHELSEDLPDAGEEASSESAEQRLARSLKGMVKLLPSPYREALWLTDYRGMTQVELAKKSGISVSGAKSRVQRARAMLKDLFFQCCHFEFDRRGTVIDYHPISCCCCAERQC